MATTDPENKMKQNYNREKIRIRVDGDELVFYCICCSSVFKRWPTKKGGSMWSMREIDREGAWHLTYNCNGDPSRLSFRGETPAL